MSSQDRQWHRAIVRDRLRQNSKNYRPLLRTICAKTFREDPLPDRPMRDRGVSLPKLKFLERD